jgi:hypothetical protein
VTPGWQGDPLAGYGAPVKINLITCLFLELNTKSKIENNKFNNRVLKIKWVLT